MARPHKATVEYFPHFVAGGKTLYILESSFGNDGYSFWFKLLEMLSSSEGHCYDCNNSHNHMFLLAKTKVSEETAEEMLNLLAELDAIDRELWVTHKVVWCQNLVDNLAEAYKRRTINLPKKPSFCIHKPTQKEVSVDINPTQTEVLESKNPQSRVDESKVKESRVEEVNACAREETGTPPSRKTNLFSTFAQEFGRPLSPMEYEQIQAWETEHSQEVITEALKRAVMQAKFNFKYIASILLEWGKNNVRTVIEVQAYESRFRKKNKGDPKNKGSSSQYSDAYA